MTTSAMFAPEFGSDPGRGHPASVFAAGQHILNLVAAAAQRAADRSRFAALSRRHLDDVGMTFADLDAALPGMDVADPRNAPSALAHSV
jgi:hypothetical protein